MRVRVQMKPLFLVAISVDGIQHVLRSRLPMRTWRDISFYAGYYAVMPYAIAQGTTEFPYILFQAVLYSAIVYSMIGFQWTAAKFMWFFFFEILSLEM